MENLVETEKIIVADETRTCKTQVRAVEKDGKRYIEGYASVYNQKSKLIWDWGGKYFEIIQKGAFDNLLKQAGLDVIHTPNHDYNKVVGRTISGTLVLESDDYGLKYTVEVPDITYANDLYESVKRGDIFESSFTFQVGAEGQRWGSDENGVDLRTITEVKELKETASVTWGAYTNTKVAARSFDDYRKGMEAEKPGVTLDLYQKKLHIINLKK